jgi:hypothetical protein
MKFRSGVILLAAATALTSAGTASAQARKITAFADVNFGMASPVQGAFASTGGSPSGGLWGSEAWTWSFGYTVPTLKGLDAAGGIFFTRNLGAGIAVSSVGSSSGAKVSTTKQNPFFPYDTASDTFDGQTALARHETGVHLQFVFKPVLKNTRVQVRLYGGPTCFFVRQTLVKYFTYTDMYFPFNPGYTVKITNYFSEQVNRSSWGVNGGVDVGYFFARNIGVGVGVRYARASVKIPNSAAEDLSYTQGQTQIIKAGGVSLGVGLRVRF